MSVDPLLIETIERLLRNVVTHEEIEHSESTGWSEATWSALAEAGFPWVGIDNARGGSGGTLHDLCAILTSVGQFAAPVPLAETAMVGGWLLAEAGLALPVGAVSAVDRSGTVRDGRLAVRGVAAWGRSAERVVVAADATVCVLRPGQFDLSHGANLAGEPRDHILVNLPLDAVEHVIVDAFDPWTAMRNRGALSRVIMSAGALSAMAQLTVDYTNARQQFGRPVAKFQAVQSHLVTAVQSAVKAQIAADVAVRALASGTVGIEIAGARVVVDEAIAIGTRAAHQAHGAMGVTREYPLHQLTRRLWAWRHEWGTTREWRREVGDAAVAGGADVLFPLITA